MFGPMHPADFIRSGFVKADLAGSGFVQPGKALGRLIGPHDKYMPEYVRAGAYGFSKLPGGTCCLYCLVSKDTPWDRKAVYPHTNNSSKKK
jgi:hypothetical protein